MLITCGLVVGCFGISRLRRRWARLVIGVGEPVESTDLVEADANGDETDKGDEPGDGRPSSASIGFERSLGAGCGPLVIAAGLDPQRRPFVATAVVSHRDVRRR